MGDPLEAKAITLSCGKLTTGVTVKLWTGIFMLRNLSSLETYFQAADYREQCLKDVVTQLEPELFEKVTGLDVKDFELLVSLDVFNDSLMNGAAYKFKRYEDASLTYAGINRHEGEKVGGYDTVVSGEDYKKCFRCSRHLWKSRNHLR